MKVELKELLLLYITITGFMSYMPQIVRLIKRKSADDFSTSTWAIWMLNSSLYLLYLIMSTENVWLVLSQLCEVSLIGTTFILVLVIKARTKGCNKTL